MHCLDNHLDNYLEDYYEQKTVGGLSVTGGSDPLCCPTYHCAKDSLQEIIILIMIIMIAMIIMIIMISKDSS